MASAAGQAPGRRRATRVKKKAQAMPTFFSGEEALMEVAKDDGLWNWALVGPDPAKLPLAGGGAKSIEEMRAAFGKHAHCFGLVRMTFGTGDEEMIRFLYVHASDDIDSGNFSSVERGKAAAMEPKMEEAIRKYAAFSAKVHMTSVEECTAQTFIDKLKGVTSGFGGEKLTMDNFNKALEYQKEQMLPEQVIMDQEQEKKKEFVEQMAAAPPAAQTHQAEPETAAPMEMQHTPTRQRKRMKLWAKGDVVEVFSVNQNKWFLDAEVVEVVKESAVRDGHRVSAGSMKVVYQNGTRFKWVGAHEMEQYLRASPRPKHPEPMLGDLQKETYFFFVTRWFKLYFELHKGFLQWWNEQAEAKTSAQPVASIYLLGLQLQQEGACFKLRADSTKGAVFTFQAESEEEASKWVEALWLQAQYCDEVHEFHNAKQGGQDMRKELMSVMMRKEFMTTVGGANA